MIRVLEKHVLRERYQVNAERVVIRRFPVSDQLGIYGVARLSGEVGSG
jgi:hypothetical protein